MALPKPIPELRLYERVLGAEWAQLDEQVRRFHEDTTARACAGTTRIRRGRGVLARAAAALFRFPRDGDAVRTRLLVMCQMGPGGPYEVWQRTFGDRNLVSRQWITPDGLLGERFDRVELALRLSTDNGALRFAATSATVVLGPLRLRVPLVLAPRVQARVAAAQRGVHVRVVVTAPLADLLLEYEGELETVR